MSPKNLQNDSRRTQCSTTFWIPAGNLFDHIAAFYCPRLSRFTIPVWRRRFTHEAVVFVCCWCDGCRDRQLQGD
jgi:hypothetical protein